MVTKATALSDVPMATHRSCLELLRGECAKPPGSPEPPSEAVLIAAIPGLLLWRHLPGWERLHGQLSVLSSPMGCGLCWALQTLEAQGWTSQAPSLPGSPCLAGKDLRFADTPVGTGLGQALCGDGALGTFSPLEQQSPRPWSPALVVPASVRCSQGTQSLWIPAALQGNRSGKLQSLQPPLPFPRLCDSLQPGAA